jgi:hypothetical protein
MMTAAAPKSNPTRKPFNAHRDTSDFGKFRDELGELDISKPPWVRIFFDFTSPSAKLFPRRCHHERLTLELTRRPTITHKQAKAKAR